MASGIRFLRTRGNGLSGRLLVLLMIGVVFQSCRKSGLFVSAGPMTTRMVSTGEFTEIELHDKVNLVLSFDSVHTVSIEGGENLIGQIETSVSDGKLTIRDNNKFKWSRDLDYEITVKVSHHLLRRLSYYGAGNVSSTNTLKAKNFTVDSWTGIGNINLTLETEYTESIVRMANADIELHGQSQATLVYCADHGSMNLSDFESQTMEIDHRSIRNSSVHVTRNVKANILYKGNVYYKGSPVVQLVETNTGRFLPLP